MRNYIICVDDGDTKYKTKRNGFPYPEKEVGQLDTVLKLESTCPSW